MPGNKNSGRKKKIEIVSVKDTDDDTDTPPLVKKKGGRPRKEVPVPNEHVHVDEVCDDQISVRQNSFNVCSLSKRTSQTNMYYDEYLGPAIDKFPASKLPHQRVVLQRYRFLLSSGQKYT